MSDWVKIFVSNDEFVIQFLQGMLKENGIISNVLNKKDHMYKFGEVELYVNEKDVSQAKLLIEQHSQNE